MREARERSQCLNGVRCSGLIFLLLVAAPPAFSGESSVSRRCETRLELRSIFARNYVLDRVRVCRREERPMAAPPVRRNRPAPPVVFGEPLAAERQRVSWDASRTTLGNAQYERSVRAGRRAFSGRAR